MRLTALAAAFLATPAFLPATAAQTLPVPSSPMQSTPIQSTPMQSSPVQATPAPDSRLPEEIERAFREMMERLRPALDDLLGVMRVFEDIDSIENYEAPEVLPNGDIIIRRRGDAPPWPPEDAPPEADPPGAGVKT